MAKKNPEPERIKKELVIRNLPVALTTEQLEEKSERLTGAILEIRRLEEDKRDYNAKIKEQIEGQRAILSTLTGIVHDRQEFSDVECTAVIDYESGRVVVHRNDNGEEIENREIAELERQMELGIEGEESNGNEGVDDSKCSSCKGFGTDSTGNGDCEDCGGSGKAEETQDEE